jgi:LysR family transcriptional regulator, hca operon transcriptional activator
MIEISVELRHLRYFIAVAEAGSLTIAASKSLHTTQPSLSRQIRDLEEEVGTALLIRKPRGVTLTEAGKAFLDHARLAMGQVDAAVGAARRSAMPNKPAFAIGFLTGQEIEWLPGVMRILRDRSPELEINIVSQTSRALAEGLLRGKLDLAFLRVEVKAPELGYRVVAREPFVVLMPSDHRLAAKQSIAPKELAKEKMLIAAAPALRAAVDPYLRRHRIRLRPAHEVDNLAMAMSLISSTRSVVLLPAYAQNFLPPSVTSRPLAGDVPTVDLAVGFHKENRSPILKLFLSRLHQLPGEDPVKGRRVLGRPESGSLEAGQSEL